MRSRLISFALLSVAAAYGLAAEGARAARGGRAAAPDSLAIIVHRSNPVENLSFEELRLYFLGERTHWPAGRRVTIVMRDPSHPERDAVLRIIYDMREQDFHAHFLRAKFTGETLEEPRLLDTTSRVLNFVFLQPGAIGCVRAAEAGPSVKVLRIDGLAPGDPGYKLTF
jgi:ABC-type phosphate transport system substrate-binding protein